MNGKTGQMLRSCFTYQEPRYSNVEEWLMRAGFCVLLYIGRLKMSPLPGQPSPNGLAHWLDFTFLSDPTVAGVLSWLFLACLPFYLFRLGDAATLPVLAVLTIASGTLGNSQGAINHGTQIMALVLLAQTAAAWWSLIRRRDLLALGNVVWNEWRRGLFVEWTKQVIAATYLVTAITKLAQSSGRWIHDVPYIVLQFAKNHDMAYFNSLREPAAEKSQFLIDLLLAQPNAGRLVFGSGLVLEALAVLALINRWWALGMGVALIAMHETISEVMHLGFVFNKGLLLVFFVNAPYWLMQAAKKLRATTPQ